MSELLISLSSNSSTVIQELAVSRFTRSVLSRLGRNQMSFDLGLEQEHFDNVSAIDTFVRAIDDSFDLVMVAERMDESLVLLRDLLCWQIDDMVVFNINKRQSKFRQSLSSEARQILRKLNAADTALYEHFTKRLNDRVAAFDRDRMTSELRYLSNRTLHLYDRCVQQEIHENSEHPRKLHYWISPMVSYLQRSFSNAISRFLRGPLLLTLR